MKIRISKTVDVDDEAAAELMAGFIEWMESNGTKIETPPLFTARHGADFTWQDLAEAFVAERNEDA